MTIEQPYTTVAFIYVDNNIEVHYKAMCISMLHDMSAFEKMQIDSK